MKKKIVAYSLSVKVYDGKKYTDVDVTPKLDTKICTHLDNFCDRLEKQANKGA